MICFRSRGQEFVDSMVSFRDLGMPKNKNATTYSSTTVRTFGSSGTAFGVLNDGLYLNRY